MSPRVPWGLTLSSPTRVGHAEARHVFAVVPTTVFAFGKEKGFTATRWRF